MPSTVRAGWLSPRLARRVRGLWLESNLPPPSPRPHGHHPTFSARGQRGLGWSPDDASRAGRSHHRSVVGEASSRAVLSDVGSPRLDGARLHLSVPVSDGVVMITACPPPRARMERAAAWRAAALPARRPSGAVPGRTSARCSRRSTRSSSCSKNRIGINDGSEARPEPSSTSWPACNTSAWQPGQGAGPERGRDRRAPRDSRGDRRRLAPRPRCGHVVRPPLHVDGTLAPSPGTRASATARRCSRDCRSANTRQSSGLIERAATLFGCVFTVSGVVARSANGP